MTDRRFYRIGGRELAAVSTTVHEFLEKQGLYRERALFQKSGGRDGDLGEETMNYDFYAVGSCNGRTRGGVALYVVEDDGANGYALMLSVIVSLPNDEKVAGELATFLENHEFVSRYSSFRERPYSHKSYRAFLDEFPQIPVLLDAFKAEGKPGKKAA